MNPEIVEEDEDQQTLKPDEEKENEESQSKIEKNSCTWITDDSQNTIELHNYTGAHLQSLPSSCSFKFIFPLYLP